MQQRIAKKIFQGNRSPLREDILYESSIGASYFLIWGEHNSTQYQFRFIEMESTWMSVRVSKIHMLFFYNRLNQLNGIRLHRYYQL